MTNSYEEAASLHLGNCNPTPTLAMRVLRHTPMTLRK